MAQEIKLTVLDTDEGLRIDRYLADNCPNLSRSYIQKLIKDNDLAVNGQPVKASYPVCEGDCLTLNVPDTVVPDILPENIPLDILYEDSDIIVVNKPKGMVVHPAAGNLSGTLVNALMYHCPDSLSGINGIERPGIVHRIDRDTTGVLVICKNDASHRCIEDQLKVHSITRRYYAVCCGTLKDDEGTISAPIGRNPNERKKMAVNYSNGKDAVTHYRVLERLNGFTYIECRLETGRTHQIRVHMSHIGHSLLGDELYGGARREYPHLCGQTLHAGVLGFIHPTSGEYMEFKAELPEYFIKLLTKLGSTEL